MESNCKIENKNDFSIYLKVNHSTICEMSKLKNIKIKSVTINFNNEHQGWANHSLNLPNGKQQSYIPVIDSYQVQEKMRKTMINYKTPLAFKEGMFYIFAIHRNTKCNIVFDLEEKN